MKNNKITLNVFDSIYNASVHKDLDVFELNDFNEVVKCLEQGKKVIKNKDDIHLFNLCSWVKNYTSPPAINSTGKENHFKHPRKEYIRRTKENVDKIYCLLLDIDENLSLVQAIDMLKEYEFFVYSSFSNSKEKDKFRVVLPLETPVLNKEYSKRMESLCKFFPEVDPASFVISQCFYFPSCSESNEDIAYTYHYKPKIKKRFNVMLLKAETPRIVVDISSATKSSNKGKDSIIRNSILKALESGRDLHYPQVLLLGTICKFQGFTFQEFRNIVDRTAAPSSTLRNKNINLKKIYSSCRDTPVTYKKIVGLMEKMKCSGLWRFKGW